MYYVIISKKPFIYLHGESEELLQSDYEFILDNPEECGIDSVTKELKSEEFQLLSPSQFSMAVDSTVTDGLIYTFNGGNLVCRIYRKSPCFYVSPEYGIEYPTYCHSPESIKAGLLTNEKLTPVVAELLKDYSLDEIPEVTLDIPENVADVVAYVCVPVIIKPIVIGQETEEEKQEAEEFDI